MLEARLARLSSIVTKLSRKSTITVLLCPLFGDCSSNLQLILFLLSREYQDLRQGQRYLQYLVERMGIPVFTEIQTALDCTAKVIKDDSYSQSLSPPAAVCSKTCKCVRLGKLSTLFRPIACLVDYVAKLLPSPHHSDTSLMSVVSQSPSHPSPHQDTPSSRIDIYMGGESPTTWLNDIALPLIRCVDCVDCVDCKDCVDC